MKWVIKWTASTKGIGVKTMEIRQINLRTTLLFIGEMNSEQKLSKSALDF